MPRPIAPSIAVLIDRLVPLGEVQVRAMFGGHGIFARGLMFAIVVGDTLYFKADDQTREVFASAGSESFVYLAKGRPMRMSYWRCPMDALDDVDVLLRYARLAIEAAVRASDAKKAKSTRRAWRPR